MSGTSIDGIDFSYLETNGTNYVKVISGISYEYNIKYISKVKEFIRKIHIDNSLSSKKMDLLISRQFLYMTNKFINEFKIDKSKIDYIGLSGQTIFHKPDKKISFQLGSGKFLSKHLNIKVISNFRQNDILNGGQGAPIGAFYNQYLTKKLNMKMAFINIGGIANICYSCEEKIIAFDVGPGNSLIDDFMWLRLKKKFDKNGNLSFKGKLNKKIINEFLKDDFFNKKYPKSLDREYFYHFIEKTKFLSNEDGVHTLSMLTVLSIIKGINLLNENFNQIVLTGGGRNNSFICYKLKEISNLKFVNIDEFGINGDLLEAEAFAYLAARSSKKLPLSLQTTTGVKKPVTGGVLYNI